MTAGHVFIAVSLDGYIARADGTIDWLAGWPDVGHDYGFAAFMDTVDGLVMGRATFETALTFPKWPYVKPVIVLSRTLGPGDVPAALGDRVRLSAALCRNLQARDGSAPTSTADVLSNPSCAQG